MEAHCLIRFWSLLRALVIVMTAVMVLWPVATSKTSAQAVKNTEAPKSSATQNQEPIPADHYDPDDTKTFPDVVTDDRLITVRQKQFNVHFFRPLNDGAAIPAIYACGDGGWRGLAPRTAQQLAHMGFAVAGIDSKVYLREFSSVKTPLSIKQLANDYVEIAAALREYAKVSSTTPVYVYGWSLGAGFAIAVGSDTATRENWAGIISIGLPRQNQLVSGVGGNYAD